METVNPRNVSMTNLEKLHSIIYNSSDVGVKLPGDRVNTMFKSTWFNELYDRMVSQVR